MVEVVVGRLAVVLLTQLASRKAERVRRWRMANTAAMAIAVCSATKPAKRPFSPAKQSVQVVGR